MRCWFSFVLILSKCRGLRASVDVHNAARCDVRQNMECVPGKGRVMESHLIMMCENPEMSTDLNSSNGFLTKNK